MAGQQPERPKRFWEPITHLQRKRLQACFVQGCKLAAIGKFDWATDLFMQCVLGDGDNLLYLQNFIGNLQKKYNNNKTGSNLAGTLGTGLNASIKQASLNQDWKTLFQCGLEMLKLNPWDTFALCELAAACEHLECNECELLFLRSALEADIKDAAVNRKARIALTRQGLERPEGPKRFWEPILPDQRKRLQASFVQACEFAATEHFDDATELFTQCVLGDGANPLYLQNFISNLENKYHNDPSGINLAGIHETGLKASIKRTSMQKDWKTLFKSGLELLKLNPWDAGTLYELSVACEFLECAECERLLVVLALRGNRRL